MKNSTLVILGAMDNEMAAIRDLAIEYGYTAIAATSGGKECHPGNAYRADMPDLTNVQTLVLVECGFRDPIPSHIKVVRCDHHNPGDPGFGLPPEQFMAASSIGQFITFLASEGTEFASWDAYIGFIKDGGKCPTWSEEDKEWWIYSGEWIPFPCGVDCCGYYYTPCRVIPLRYVLIAAADHCLWAAYRGECPGALPDLISDMRIKDKAAFRRQKCSVCCGTGDIQFDDCPICRGTIGQVEADITSAKEELNQSPKITLGGQEMADMRRPIPVPELPEAACQLGMSYISGPLIGPDKRLKYTVSGSKEVVSAWMQEWAIKEGLTGVYGDPIRGFAGGYAQ